jgi:hypothetical protein
MNTSEMHKKLMCKPNYINYDNSFTKNEDGSNAVFSSWMEFHTDEFGLGKGGTYTFTVFDINPNMDAYLVHWVNGEFVFDEIKTNHSYTFRANRRHGVFPKRVAEEIGKTQSIKPANAFIKTVYENNEYPCFRFTFVKEK